MWDKTARRDASASGTTKQVLLQSVSTRLEIPPPPSTLPCEPLCLLRRVIGQPKECVQCAERLAGCECPAGREVPRTSYGHVQECAGVWPTALLQTGQVIEALHAIIRVCRYCLGWSTEAWEAEVRLERAALERRKLEWQQGYDSGMMSRGAHAYWRHFASTRRTE